MRMMLPHRHYPGDVTQTHLGCFPYSSHHPHGAFQTPGQSAFYLCQKTSPIWSKIGLKQLHCCLIPGERQSNA